MITSTDRIERQVLLKAPKARVWRALTDAGEFGRWFGVDLKGAELAAGRHVRGKVTHPGYEHLDFEITIERFEPPTRYAWRWHPAAVDAGMDYSAEPTTLVEFELKEVTGGTLLTVVESGFDQVPPSRRLTAFRMNTDGWDEQMRNIARHVASRE